MAAFEQKANGKEVKIRYCPNLASDGAVCDVNYIRLCQLMPEMANNDKIGFGVASRHHDSARISMEVIERCRYTTIVSICFSDMNPLTTDQWEGLRAMQIRIYHDLKTAEVVSCDHVRQFKSRYEYPNTSMQHPDEKSQMNRFLGELLSHCLANGHALDWHFEHDCELQFIR
jgi:uncharacterized protein YqiB (DUF1249 family)